MSWSIGLIGTPDNICAALDEQSGKMDGQSKVEFDAALPHLKALVSDNFNKQYGPPSLLLEASGHGSVNMQTGEQTQRYVQVSIKGVPARVV